MPVFGHIVFRRAEQFPFRGLGFESIGVCCGCRVELQFHIAADSDILLNDISIEVGYVGLKQFVVFQPVERCHNVVGAGWNFHLDIVDVEFVALIIIRLKVPRFIEIAVVYGRFVGLPLFGRFVPVAFHGVERLVGARCL